MAYVEKLGYAYIDGVLAVFTPAGYDAETDDLIYSDTLKSVKVEKDVRELEYIRKTVRGETIAKKARPGEIYGHMLSALFESRDLEIEALLTGDTYESSKLTHSTGPFGDVMIDAVDLYFEAHAARGTTMKYVKIHAEDVRLSKPVNYEVNDEDFAGVEYVLYVEGAFTEELIDALPDLTPAP